jgi:hypothetical protein
VSRADVVQALRDYLYYREAVGDVTLAMLDAPDVVDAIRSADTLVGVVCRTLDVKRYELMS